jgi:ABC-2 type transport system ATP-binding protein
LPADNGLPPGAVAVRGLWERFRIYHSRPRGLKDRLIRFEKASYEDLWALQDVSFELEPGETFAVMGANGSGKSTLLKCLARILPPDKGVVHIGGGVASLLELGAGFKGDLSGRENIYLNGSILGLHRNQIDRLVDDIIDFSGVREFIDSPVRNYSSGMHVRLGFAIAVHCDPDVLIIDEILAVGDAAFQTKCFEAMHDFKRRGKTMILVTHDMDSASRLCDRALLLDHGKVLIDGPTRQTVDLYRQLVLEQSVGLESPQEAATPAAGPPPERWGTGGATIEDVALLNSSGAAVTTIEPGARATFRMRVRFREDADEPIFGFHLRADDGTDLHVTNTMWRGVNTGKHRAGSVVEVRFEHVHPLLPGRYRYTCAVAYEDATQWYEWWDDCLEFHVSGVVRDGGRMHLNSEITLTPLEA